MPISAPGSCEVSVHAWSKRQEGVAIIGALLVVTAVTVIVTGLIGRESARLDQVDNEQQRLQARWILQGGLLWVRQGLDEQRRSDPLTHLQQPWATGNLRLALAPEQAPYEAWIEDEQGKFNLRNLVLGSEADPRAEGEFLRLAALLEVPSGQAQRVIARVLRSVGHAPAGAAEALAANAGQMAFDSGRDTSPNAALRYQPASLPALRRFADLAATPGIEPRTLERLRDYVTVLPGNTWVNANTAPAVVLAAMVPGSELSRMQQILAERDRGLRFLNRGDFANRLGMPGLQASTLRVGITSGFFLIHGRTLAQGRAVTQQALVRRQDDGSTHVLWSES